MNLKKIFKMTKTDRYTQDGRDELAKLQETEDVRYKTGDISQKTGLQKQPDGSWAPPKKGARSGAGKPEAAEGWTETRMASGKLYDLKSQGKRIIEQYDPETETKTFKLRDLNNSRAPDKEFKTLEEAKAAAAKKEAGSINRTPERIAKETAIMEALNLSTGEDNNLHKMSDETIERLYAKTQEKPTEKHPPKVMPKGMHPAEFMKAWEDDAKKNGYKKGQGNEWREHLRNEESKTDTKEQTKALMEKYKDLPGVQKKDALYAATFEGSPIGMTQTSMERQGWDLVQADDDVNVYAKPDGSKVTMKHDGQKITRSEYEAPGSTEKKQLIWSPNASVSEKLNDIIKLGEGSEDRTTGQGKYISPKVQENYVRKALSKRLGATEESIEDLIDSMDEKAIKNAFNGFMENYSSDSAPRQLTGDCKIRIRQTQDVKYKTGDISQKTGLQKQPDGSWAPPKKGGAAPKMGSPEYNEKYGLTKRDVATGKEIDRIYEKHQKRIKELKAKGYTDEQIENDKIYQQTKEDMRNVGKSKPAAGLTKIDGKGNKVEIKITETKGGGFYIDKYVNGKKIGINNANTRESAEEKARSMMEQHMADPDYKAESKPAATGPKQWPDILTKEKIKFRWDERDDGKEGFLMEDPDGGQIFIDEKDVEGEYPNYTIKAGSAAHEAFNFHNSDIKLKVGSNGGNITSTGYKRGTSDSAPRILTGDTKIRIKK